jgi:hypothetical protein
VNLDFGAPALDVAIALSFVFFLLSVVASAITEGVAGLRKWRAKKLVEGIRGMLGDENVASALLEHPLVRTELGFAKERKPSYLSSRNFALALTDVLTAGEVTDSKGVLESVQAKVREPEVDSDLATQLRALLVEAGADRARFQGSLEKWFDDSMDRVSGWYKRKSQLFTIAIAVVVTLGLNASAVRITERLVAEPTVRAAVVAQAEQAVEKGGSTTNDALEQGTSLKAAGKGAEAAYKELMALKLPILWYGENSPFKSGAEFWLSIAGWLITIVAISLGAPFWFDALGKLAHLRTSGKKPEPETGK